VCTPRITAKRREARREQILEAARACLQEGGLEAVSMEMIIARSGLSTGAVYGYFKGKDEIINAVVTDFRWRPPAAASPPATPRQRCLRSAPPPHSRDHAQSRGR
jgi:AcrR family transcriptional regulator